MQKNAPKILLTGWCLWLALRLVRVVLDPVWRSPGFFYVKSAAFGGFVVPALGCWLAWRLYQRPRRVLSVWFALVCIIALCKFYLSVILFFTLPSFGGHTFGGACMEWLHRSTSGVLPFLDSIPPMILLIVSAIYWPGFCFTQRDLKCERPVAIGRAVESEVAKEIEGGTPCVCCVKLIPPDATICPYCDWTQPR